MTGRPGTRHNWPPATAAVLHVVMVYNYYLMSGRPLSKRDNRPTPLAAAPNSIPPAAAATLMFATIEYALACHCCLRVL